MSKGTKSFSFAAFFFDQDCRNAARELYAWCRYCDDAIDQASTPSEAKNQLQTLEDETRRALNNEDVTLPEFHGLKRLCQVYRIPSQYPLDLLEGMRMDVEGHGINSTAELRLYCYRVAGVVGLMMAHIMGIPNFEKDVLRRACDTGLAMQMTNIARDVRDDFNLERIYLPREWFTEAGVHFPDITNGFRAEDFAPVVERLLREADLLYVSGREGLKALPFRAELAVSCAQEIYRDIGRVVLGRKLQAWDSRSYVSHGRKIILAIKVGLLTITRRFLPAGLARCKS
jgi:phytoene synthase